MKKQTTTQFGLGFNGLSKKVMASVQGMQMAEVKIRMAPNDRFAKKGVTVRTRTLRCAKWAVFKLLARDLEIKQGVGFDGTVVDLVPPWQVTPITIEGEQDGDKN